MSKHQTGHIPGGYSMPGMSDGDLFNDASDMVISDLTQGYWEHREPCECPACQAGAYCAREIERVSGNCGE